MNRLMLATALVAGTMAGTAQASSVVTLNYEGYHGGGINTNFGTRSAGIIKWTQVAGDTPEVHLTSIGNAQGFITFCIEAFESLSGGHNTYHVLDAAQAPNNNVGGPNPNPMGVVRADNLSKLFAVGFLGTDLDDWKVNGSFDLTYIKAFQLAVWEVVNENVVQGLQMLNIMQSSGNRGAFYSTYGNTNNIATTAQNLLDMTMATENSVELIAFGSPFESLTARIQDQVTVRNVPPSPPVVPTPAAAGAGLLGLAGLLARRNKA